jgi:hypothetical protein
VFYVTKTFCDADDDAAVSDLPWLTQCAYSIYLDLCGHKNKQNNRCVILPVLSVSFCLSGYLLFCDFHVLLPFAPFISPTGHYWLQKHFIVLCVLGRGVSVSNLHPQPHNQPPLEWFVCFQGECYWSKCWCNY